MADVFVKDRDALKAVTNAAAGDVYYLTDQNEVYDIINTKLTLGYNAVKVGSGVWAVLNPVKSLNHNSIKPGEWVLTKKYTKGTVVNKGGIPHVANGDIAASTAWATGTSGATWRVLRSSRVISVGGITPVARPASSVGIIVTIADAFKAPFNMYVTKISFICTENSGAGCDIGAFGYNNTAGTVSGVYTATGLTTTNSQTDLAIPNLYVASGEYVGLLARKGGLTRTPYRTQAGVVIKGKSDASVLSSGLGSFNSWTGYAALYSFEYFKA